MQSKSKHFLRQGQRKLVEANPKAPQIRNGGVALAQWAAKTRSTEFVECLTSLLTRKQHRNHQLVHSSSGLAQDHLRSHEHRSSLSRMVDMKGAIRGTVFTNQATTWANATTGNRHYIFVLDHVVYLEHRLMPGVHIMVPSTSRLLWRK